MSIQPGSVSDAVTPAGVANRQWVLRAMDSGHEFALQGEMLVGREAECQIPVLSGHISRYHAKIRATNNGVILEDLNSTNGTFVNGRRLTAPKVLALGDEVVFHTERFRLVSGRSGDAEATMIMASPARLVPRRDAVAAVPVKVPEPEPASDASIAADSASASVPAAAPPLAKASEFVLPPVARVNVPDDATRILSGVDIALKAERSRLHTQDTSRVAGSGPRLVVMTAPLRGKVLNLSEQKLGTTWRIGRGESCEMRINEGTVSHDHARVVRSTDGWQIAVTSARNAMVVNGEVQTSHALRNGDRLLLGRMEIVFATDVDEAVPVVVAPPNPVFTNPWVIGGMVFVAVATLGILVASLF